MKKPLLWAVLIITCYSHAYSMALRHQPYEWTVIGAGPAGIAAIASLLDHGINKNNLLWIDTEFSVGRIGKFYDSVPSNSPAEYFLKFIAGSPSFADCSFGTSLDKLNSLPRLCWAQLKHITNPLQHITRHLRKKISSIEGIVTAIQQTPIGWKMDTKLGAFHTHNLILATGSKPKKLFPSVPEPIHLPLDYALDRSWLKKNISPDDTIAVFGSSHSAVLVMRHLWLLGVKAIINFYRAPFIYSHYKDETAKPDELIHPYEGLKGVAAEWASTILEPYPPANLVRVVSTPEAIAKVLPSCTKVIYAVGYERTPVPISDNISLDTYDKNGMIARGLFGVGIAFPQEYTDIEGNTEKTIGITDFLLQIQKSIPVWLASSKKQRKQK